MKKFVQFLGLHAHEHSLFIYLAGTKEIHGDFHHSCTCTFAIAGLEHPKFAVLDCELHVLHILVMFFKIVGDFEEFLSAYGHGFFERRIFALTLIFRYALKGSPTARTFESNLLRCTYAGYNVFTLCIDKVFAIEKIFAGSCVTAESNACSGIFTHVAIYHSLHVHGCAPLFRNLVHSTVKDGTFVHPTIKHGADAAPKLFPCAVRKIFTCKFFYRTFEKFYKVFKIFDAEFCVELYAFVFLNLIHDFFKGVNVVFALGFHAKNDIAIHLHKTAVAVPSKTGITAFVCEAFDSGIIHAEVEDSVHHTRHGSAGTGTHADEQRIGRVVEFLTGKSLNMRYRSFNLFLDAIYNLILAILCILGTNLCCNGETGRHGHAEQVHFCQIGALAAEKISHPGISFGFTVAECVDSFHWLIELIMVFY